MPPRLFSFSAQRCRKSEGDQRPYKMPLVTAKALTYGPFRLFVIHVCLLRQLAVHLAETVDCVCCPIGHFEMVAESAVNHESRDCKLQTNSISSVQGVFKRRYSH